MLDLREPRHPARLPHEQSWPMALSRDEALRMRSHWWLIVGFYGGFLVACSTLLRSGKEIVLHSSCRSMHSSRWESLIMNSILGWTQRLQMQ